MALVTLLGPDEDVGNVLVFAEEGDVEENFQGYNRPNFQKVAKTIAKSKLG